MNGDEIVLGVVGCCSFCCVALAVVDGFRGLPLLDKIMPFIVQLAAWGVLVFPLLHGTPNEHFFVFLLSVLWVVIAGVCSYRLRRSAIRTARVLGGVQAVMGITVVMLVGAGYVRSCYLWRGLGWYPP